MITRVQAAVRRQAPRLWALLTPSHSEQESCEQPQPPRHMAAMPGRTAAALIGTSLALPVATAASGATVVNAAVAGAAAGTTVGGILAVAAPLSFGFLQLSGLRTVAKIKRDRAVGSVPPLPFFSLATNCFVWTLYGQLASDLTVLVPNFTGLCLGLYYVSVYRRFSTASLARYYAGSAAIAGLVTATLLLSTPAVAERAIGLTGCALAVILMASPLATMRTVLATKSTASMPFATSLAGWMNAATWSGYGLLVANNAMVYAPNLMGLAAASLQLALFAKYGIHTEAAAGLPVTAEVRRKE